MKRLILPALISASCIVVMAAVDPETITYRYDARGRLVRVVHEGGVNNGVQANYTYDDADNREMVNVSGA